MRRQLSNQVMIKLLGMSLNSELLATCCLAIQFKVHGPDTEAWKSKQCQLSEWLVLGINLAVDEELQYRTQIIIFTHLLQVVEWAILEEDEQNFDDFDEEGLVWYLLSEF